MWLQASFRLGRAGGVFFTFRSAYPTSMLGLRYAYATEVEKSALKEAVFNTMLLKALQRALEALAASTGMRSTPRAFLILALELT